MFSMHSAPEPTLYHAPSMSVLAIPARAPWSALDYYHACVPAALPHHRSVPRYRRYFNAYSYASLPPPPALGATDAAEPSTVSLGHAMPAHMTHGTGPSLH